MNDDVAAVGVDALLLVDVRCPPNPFWLCCCDWKPELLVGVIGLDPNPPIEDESFEVAPNIIGVAGFITGVLAVLNPKGFEGIGGSAEAYVEVDKTPVSIQDLIARLRAHSQIKAIINYVPQNHTMSPNMSIGES